MHSLSSVTKTLIGQLDVYNRMYRSQKRIGYMLGTLTTENTQNAFADTSRSFTTRIQRLWAISHDDDNESGTIITIP